MRDLIATIMWMLIAIICFAMLIQFSGCASLNPGEIPPTPQQVLYKTVSKTNWLATAAIVGIAVSAFAFLNGNKMGIAGMVSCFIALSMTLAVARYAAWLAAGGAIGSIGLLIYSIFVKDRALTEIIGNVHSLKDKMDYEDAGDGFTYEPVINEFLDKQSKTTKQIVKKVKKQINGASSNPEVSSCCTETRSCVDV